MTTFERYYRANKEKLLKSSCPENAKLYIKFFDREEIKLKRTNDLRKLDEGCYNTLNGYTQKIMNVNIWFDNKPLKDITKKMFEKFYNDFEDGKILNNNNKPFADRRGYYGKIFTSTLFDMAGKKEMIKEVLQFRSNGIKEDVRFIKEEDFRKLQSVMIKLEHKLIAWLAFDIGENIGALLQLTKRDCTRIIDENIESI